MVASPEAAVAAVAGDTCKGSGRGGRSGSGRDCCAVENPGDGAGAADVTGAEVVAWTTIGNAPEDDSRGGGGGGGGGGGLRGCDSTATACPPVCTNVPGATVTAVAPAVATTVGILSAVDTDAASTSPP